MTFPWNFAFKGATEVLLRPEPPCEGSAAMQFLEGTYYLQSIKPLSSHNLQQDKLHKG